VKYSFAIALLLSAAPAALCQKPPVDTNALATWTRTGDARLSNNGKYVYYSVRSGMDFSRPVQGHIQSMPNGWKTEMPITGPVDFSDDSRLLIFMAPHDSLCLLTLGAGRTEHLAGVSGYKLFKRGGTEWMICQKTDRNLVLRKMSTGEEKVFTGVDEYLLMDHNNSILLKTSAGGNAGLALQWIDLLTGKTTAFWHGAQAGNFVPDPSGRQLAFSSEDGGDHTYWLYTVGKDKAQILATNASKGLLPDGRLDNIEAFSKDGRKLFFKVKEKDFPQPSPDAVKVDVWSYTDAKLQEQQLKELGGEGGPGKYLAVIHLADGRILQLEHENERSTLFGVDFYPDEYFPLIAQTGIGDERNWNRLSQPVFYNVSLNTGEKKPVHIDVHINGWSFEYSPAGRFCICHDAERRNVYNYDAKTGKSVNITAGLPIPTEDTTFDDNPEPRPRDLTIISWTDQDSMILFRDKFDFWLVDPRGLKAPVSLTNGYGRKNNIVFRLAEDLRNKPFRFDKPILLAAFNEHTKDNGFYRMLPGKPRDPEMLTMGPYLYCMPEYPRGLPDPLPVKARDAALWIVHRESASQAPNYFSTTDWKHFTPISNVHPEKAYNWMTSELVHFKTTDGRMEVGALYKPENFDPNKKYPIIIHYYEKLAHRLNVFEEPETIANNLNIPWFVSRGYLVFTPDIQYTIGSPGKSALLSVEGAARRLQQMPWVDAAHIGIQGHSWGGFETNYIVTHTDVFAAAMASSGISDCISEYNMLIPDAGMSKQFFYELHQSRMGPTLWQRPDLYLENSALLQADRITTPLLMMQNKKDGVIPFEQGIEFFTALRRLGKKAWMLQYDGQNHSLMDDKVKALHTVRVLQFFDHYLKGMPAPVWMTRGIPAKRKGIDMGLEPDTEIKTPGNGLLK
jgi:dienelactone hydrolase